MKKLNHCESAVFCFLLLGVITWLTGLFSISHAQSTPPAPITSSGLNTQISAPIAVPGGSTQHDITGGTRPGKGPNLFHSFGDFNVPTNNIANFLNETALPTTNILGRVNSGNPSNVFGTIQTTGFGNANLFLINPAGFLFGPTATLNVGGAVTFTSADYVRLADGIRFNAMPGPQDTLLSVAPVAAFGFLGSDPGAISIQGATLQVPDGKPLSLIGGDIEMVEGSLKAPDGSVQLASLAGRGEVMTNTGGSSEGFAITPSASRGSITLTGTGISSPLQIDTSGDPGGRVAIQGGQLTMENVSVAAETFLNSNQSGRGIFLEGTRSITLNQVSLETDNVNTLDLGVGVGGTGSISITTPAASFKNVRMETITSSKGAGGDISLNVGTLTTEQTALRVGASPFDFAGGGGPGGNISIKAKQDIHLNQSTVLSTSANGKHDGGKITISARTLSLSALGQEAGGGIFSGNDSLGSGSTGRAGDIAINVRNLVVHRGSIQGNTSGGASGPMINIRASESVLVDHGSISNTGIIRNTGVEVGKISITTPLLTLNNFGSVLTQITAPIRPRAGAGDISLHVDTLNVLGGGRIATSLFPANPAQTGSAGGNINIRATKAILVSGATDFQTSGVVSGLPSSILSDVLGAGTGGKIHLATPNLRLGNQGVISTLSTAQGQAGDISLDVGRLAITSGARVQSLSTGEFAGSAQAGSVGTVTVHAKDLVSVSGKNSGIFAETQSSGNSGTVNVQAHRVQLKDEATISASSTGGGTPGHISIDSAKTITVDNNTITSAGPVQGGTISLHAGKSIQIRNGSLISADNTGVGDAGHIVIEAGRNLTSHDSAISAQAGHGNGGTIILQAADKVRLIDSQVNTSVSDGPETVAGNILIESKGVRLKNSQVLSNAIEGDGGNINITTKAFHSDSASVVDASSQFGTDGTVTIQPPAGRSHHRERRSH